MPSDLNSILAHGHHHEAVHHAAEAAKYHLEHHDNKK